MITMLPLLLLLTFADPAPPTGETHVNALANETSPYLLQHQHNPVDWMPWGDEAIQRARDEDKPIFLSIGYSTCYWCHVMERESFETEAVAAVINEHFIPIKVDREERPDVDEIYMTGVQVLTGRGGWPISLFLDPFSLSPFAGGTYFPPKARYNKPGFTELLLQVNEDWSANRDVLEQRGFELGQQIKTRLSTFREPQNVSKALVARAAAQVLGNYDPKYGGFRKSAPKFPIPVQLLFLLETSMDDPRIELALRHTLDQMAMGGMYDQVGGGFHRYSTDVKWLVPHFEKMLYDNGQLARVYARAYELTDDPFYAEVTREILEYVLREMLDAQGGFHSAQDAEVNHREGQNYLWMPDEVSTTLTAAGRADLVDTVFAAYGLNAQANFRDPHHRDEPARHVLHLVSRPDVVAAGLGLEVDVFNQQLAEANAILLVERDTRDQPSLDDKVLAAWNGLMITGFAEGGRVLGEQRFIDAAARAADFILEDMVDEDGNLQRSWRNGSSGTNAFLEDYAFMIQGLLALHAASGDPVRLEQAKQLALAAKSRFWNEEHGGYWDTESDQSDLLVRARVIRDSVQPTGNSVMIDNLAILAERTDEGLWRDDLTASIRGMSPWLAQSPVTPIHATGVLHRLDDDMLLSIAPRASARNGVSMAATPGTLNLPSGGKGRFELRIDVPPGFHLNAPDPLQPELLGLQVTALGDVATIDVAYPDPVVWTGPIGSMLVYEGTIVLLIDVQRIKSSVRTNRVQLIVRYQLCNDEVCLQPRAEVVPVQLMLK